MTSPVKLSSGANRGSAERFWRGSGGFLASKSNVRPKIARQEGTVGHMAVEMSHDETFNDCLGFDDFDLDEKSIISLEETLKRVEQNYVANPKHYTLFSGGANGSDMYWQNVGASFGIRVKAFSFEGHGKRSSDRVVLTDEQLRQADEYLHRANKTLKRHFPTSKSFVNNLLRRNWYQVKDTNGVFAVGKLSASRKLVEGGTGWAVQMAIDAKKPVYVFDTMSNSWHRYIYEKKKFISCGKTPRLNLNFTGIGTRDLPDKGKAAIEHIFEETFGKLQTFRR